MNSKIKIPHVGVIIVTWNKKKDILHLLGQIQTINYPSEKLEIVVVDNCSSDGTPAAIESSYPDITLIKHLENRGGSGGFNAGMRWALQNRPQCDYLWLLDNDVIVDKNALTELVSVMEKNPQAAICGSKIMNRDNHDEMIEVGAFIDYQRGDIRRNMPPDVMLRNSEAVFEVDYVAACSLVVRSHLINKTGLWQERLFIYWDDMEWGARFNADGYKVLASNASIVYHPSWATRASDNSAVWRCYYRSRNSLWFFNNYTSGIKRRFLLTYMIARFQMHALSVCLRSESAFSGAFTNGIRDFFSGNYGKKDFRMPQNDIFKYLDNPQNRNICIFVQDSDTTAPEKTFILRLMERYADIRVSVIVPASDKHKWTDITDKIMTFTRIQKGAISLSNKGRIMKFLYTTSWNVLFTPPLVPRMGALWGRDVARIDFQTGTAISIERIPFRHLFRTVMLALPLLLRVFMFPPSKTTGAADLHKNA